MAPYDIPLISCFRRHVEVDVSKKATIVEDDVSSTQEPSEVSSFVFHLSMDKNIDRGRDKGSQGKEEKEEKPVDVVEVSLPTSPSMKFVPFMSLDIQGDSKNGAISSISKVKAGRRTSSVISSVPTHIYISSSSQSINSDVTIPTTILDPTEPLLYGKLDETSDIALYAGMMHCLLTRHFAAEHGLVIELLELIIEHPEVCQVRYPSRASEFYMYPLAMFCRDNDLELIQAAYEAFPEAVGLVDNDLGMGLHYACASETNIDTVQYLLEIFPEAARRTNRSHETPLHLLCRAKRPDLAVLDLLLQYYPAAAQTADNSVGYTPLHQVLENNNYTVFQRLIETSPMAITAVTADLQKSLHIAAGSGASNKILKKIIEQDPSQARFTDERFQTPLHRAVFFYCTHNTKLKNVQYLVTINPDALKVPDANDERPIDLAQRLLEKRCSNDRILQLLDPTSHRSPTLASK